MMTNKTITISCSSDDHIALSAFSMALNEMAMAHTGEVPEDVKAFYAMKKVEEEAVSRTVEETPEIDSEGYPWDERIHAPSRAMTDSGKWRNRRKPKDMDEAEWLAHVESVKAELMPSVVENVIVPPPEVVPFDWTSALDVVPVPDVVPDVAAEDVVPVPPPVVPVPEVTAPDASGVTTFAQLMKFITSLYGKISREELDRLAGKYHLTAFQQFAQYPEHINDFAEDVLNALNA